MLTQQLKAELSHRNQIQAKLRELQAKYHDLEKELADEKDKNQSSLLHKEIEHLKKQVKAKDQELVALKKSIEAVKAEYLKISGKAAEKEEVMQDKLKKTAADQEMQVKMALDRIQALDKKTKELSKELEEIKIRELQLKGENTTLKEELAKEKQANENQRLMLRDAQTALGKSQKDLKEAKSKESKKVGEFFEEAKAEETKALEEKVKFLEAEIALLKTGSTQQE